MKKLIRFIKRLLLVVWLLVMIVAGSWLGYDNSQDVNVSLFGVFSMTLSLGKVIGLSLLVGVGLGFVTSYLFIQGKQFQRKRELARTKKEMDKILLSQKAG